MRRILAIPWIVVAIACVSVTSLSAHHPLDLPPPPLETHHLRMRLVWGGGPDQTWRVVVRTNDAVLADVRLLGLDPETPGSCLIKANELAIGQGSATNYGGVDFSVDGYSNSRLSLEISSEENPQFRYQRTLQLEQLKSETLTEFLDDQQSRIHLTRAPGDTLRVEFDRPHLIFEPGETWPLTIQPNLTMHADGQGLRLQARITPARATAPVEFTRAESVTFDAWGSAGPLRWQIPVPQREGVYDLTLSFDSPWYQAKLAGPREIRKIQFVVLGSAPPQTARPAAPPLPLLNNMWLTGNQDQIAALHEEASNWQLLGELLESKSPTRFHWASGVGGLGTSLRTWRWNAGSGSERDAETQLPSTETDTHELGHAVQLAPGQSQSFPLRIAEPNRPHRLTLTYSGPSPVTASLSILQPDITGVLSNFGFNSGFLDDSDRHRLQSNSEPATGSRKRQHQFVFWPNHEKPVLMLSNRHAKHDLTIESIQLEQGPPRLGESPARRREEATRRQRLAFLELPLLAENFGGEKFLDPGSGESLDDWVTFYRSADRFVQYLQQAGYTGAMVAVNAQGGALYPSESLQPTPRFDSGIFFSTGQDPVPKDIVELLSRMFDRAGLSLVPALTTDGPLPELEQRLTEAEDQDGIRLRDHRGERISKASGLPRYNPLSPTVRQAIEQVLSELTERYHDHESFEGIALVCRGDTCTTLPGRRWGYDLATVSRFYRDSGQESLPTAETLAQFISQGLLDRDRSAWIDWRCQQLAQNFGEWERAVKKHAPDARLYLASVDLFRIGDLAQSLSPSLHTPANLKESLRDIGWDPSIWPQYTSAVFLRPRRIAPQEPLAQQRIEMHVDHSRQMDQLFSKIGETGEIFCRRDEWTEFQNLGESLPGTTGDAELFRLQTLGPGAESSCRRFAEALFRFDSQRFVDGGWTVITDLGPELIAWFDAYSRLPEIKFRDVPNTQGRTQVRPLAVRQVVTEKGQWFGYVVNSSPWTCEVDLRFDSPPLGLQATPASAMTNNTASSNQTAISSGITVQIPPYGLVSLSQSRTDAQLTNYESRLPELATQRIKQHLHRLQSKLTVAAQTAPLQVLVDSGCQDLGRWSHRQAEPMPLQVLEDPTATDGKAIQMQSRGEVVWMRSNWFPNPQTGRLTLSVWLKSDSLRDQAPVRIAIESDETGIDYYRFGAVGGLSRGETANQIESDWKQFLVHFDDLPINPRARLRVGLDLMGTGTIQVDRFELYDRWFDENDLKAITQYLASAGPLLANPATVDEARVLLQGYWPQFIDQMIQPETLTRLPERIAEGTSAEASAGGDTDEDTASAASTSREGFMFRRLRRPTKNEPIRQR